MNSKHGASLKALVRRARRRFRSWFGRDLYIAVQDKRGTEYHGSDYGGWAVVPESLSANSIVYSIGIGDDVSFDLSMIRRYGLTVHAFDPTPRSVNWVRAQTLPPGFSFHDKGIAAHDGVLILYPPENEAHMSFTVIDRTAAKQNAGVEVAVARLSTLMRNLGHDRIDVLKMDIEGAEYDVLRTLEEDAIYPEQILVEFHHRFFDDGIERTRSAIKRLNDMRYRLVAVSSSGEELTFLRSGH